MRPQLDQSQIMGMGQELPLVAALHREWAKAMNGRDVPFVDAPDLEVTPFGWGEFSGAPGLGFNAGSRQVELVASDVGASNAGCGSGLFQ